MSHAQRLTFSLAHSMLVLHTTGFGSLPFPSFGNQESGAIPKRSDMPFILLIIGVAMKKVFSVAMGRAMLYPMYDCNPSSYSLYIFLLFLPLCQRSNHNMKGAVFPPIAN